MASEYLAGLATGALAHFVWDAALLGVGALFGLKLRRHCKNHHATSVKGEHRPTREPARQKLRAIKEITSLYLNVSKDGVDDDMRAIKDLAEQALLDLGTKL